MSFPKAADLNSNWKPFCPMSSFNQPPPQPASAGTGSVNAQRAENNSGPIHANAAPGNPEPAKKAGVSGSAAGRPRGTVVKTTARKKVGAVLKNHTSGCVESGIGPSRLGSEPLNRNVGSGQTAVTRGININEVAKPADGSTILNFGGGEEIGFDLDVGATDAILGNLQHLPFLREDDNNRRML
jgi:hypothetical protein